MKLIHALVIAGLMAVAAVTFSAEPTAAMGKPGVTPVPCPTQEWQLGDPAFEALAGAKAFFGQYDGAIYRIEIPDSWNGELVLYAHGFVSNGGPNGSQLRVGNDPIRDHLVKNGFAWAASSYRCNGYVPGQGLVDTMALVDLFTKANNNREPQGTYLTGTSMGGHVTLFGMQEFPTSFAGGLAMCPAGSELFDYFAAVSAAAEVITGVSFARDTLQQDAAKMGEILGKAPDYTDKGRALASVEIQLSGGPRPAGLGGWRFRESPGRRVQHALQHADKTPRIGIAAARAEGVARGGARRARQQIVELLLGDEIEIDQQAAQHEPLGRRARAARGALEFPERRADHRNVPLLDRTGQHLRGVDGALRPTRSNSGSSWHRALSVRGRFRAILGQPLLRGTANVQKS